MWDRALASARRFRLDLGGRLASWRLSIVLMVVAALYYAFLAIWSGSSPPHVVRNIASLIPFWLLYVLLLVNTALCLWKRLPTLRRDLRMAPRREDASPDWRVETPGIDRNGAPALLRGLGYRVATTTGGALLGVRRRWSALGTFLFHGAFFLVASGFLLTAVARQDATLWVAAGEDFEGRPDQFIARSTPRLIGSGVSPGPFRVSEIRPEFWRDQLLFTTLEADLVFADDSERTTRINRPLWIGPATFLRLSGFGYALRYELRDRQMRVLDSAFVKLDVFPPGQKDYFRIPDYPHRFYVEVLPDMDEEDGRPYTRSLNLAAPGVVLDVFRGRLGLGGGVLRHDQGFEFEGLTVGFPEIRYWGELSAVSDPGIPVLFAGYVLGLGGLLLKLRGRRQEVLWRSGDAGHPGVLRGWGAPRPDPAGLAAPRGGSALTVMDASANLATALLAVGTIAAALGFVAWLRPNRPAVTRAADGAGVVTTVLALAAWLVRWRAAGHLPLFGTYESSLSLAVAVMLAALVARARVRVPAGVWPAASLVAVALVTHGLRYDRTIFALTISERSWVVEVHAWLAWAAFGALSVNAALALTRVVRREQDARVSRGLSFSLSLGFALHTAMMASGSFYKFLLFGEAWTFDPIETLGFVAWVAYGAILHMHLFAAWDGVRLARWCLSVFMLLVVSYRGIVYFPSWSSYHIFDMDLRTHITGPGSPDEGGSP